MMSRHSARSCATALVSALALLAACSSDTKTTPAPTPTPTPQVVSLAVSAASPSLAKGTSLALTAKAVYDDGSVVDVTEKATWSSSDAAIANVVMNETAAGAYVDCRASALKVGSAQISAAFGGKSGSVAVEVTKEQAEKLAATVSSASMAKGTKQAASVSGTFTDGSHQDVSSDATWTSSDSSVAAVVAGQVEARGVGTATLTATFEGKSADVAVTVTAATLTGIAINEAPFKLIAELEKQLSVTGFFTDGTAQAIGADWSSDDLAVASVSSAGLVSAKAKGSATITAASGTFSKSIVVTVDDPKLIAVEIASQSGSLPKGLPLQLAAMAKFDNGKAVEITRDDATLWSSSSQAIAAVSGSGLVTASKVNTGAVKIMAQFGGFGGVFDLTVTPAVATNIVIAPAAFTLPAGLSKQFVASASFSDDSFMSDASSQVAWSTSDSKICSVSKGLLSTFTAGKCTLTASLPGASGPVTGSADVTVSDAALTKITITPLATQLKALPLGLKQQFAAEGAYTDGSSHPITAQVVWTSSNDGAASISNASVDKGLASGLAIGSTTIKAEDPDTHLANTIALDVIDAVVMKLDISCSPLSIPRAVAPYNRGACSATGTFSVPGLVRELTDTEDVRWNISDEEMAAISGAGLVTTTPTSKLGTATVTATYPGRDGLLVASNEVHVEVTDAVLVGIDVYQNCVNERLFHSKFDAPPFYPVAFTAKGRYSDGRKPLPDLTASATWKVSDESPCSIAGNVATGSEPGVCTVSASQQGVTSNSVSFDVLDLVLNGIEVDPIHFAVPAGVEMHYSAWGLYVHQGTFFPYEYAFTDIADWTVVDAPGSSGVASVSNAAGSKGLVDTNVPGTAQVVATFRGISGAARLDVNDKVLVSLAISPTEATINKGLDQEFKVVGTYSDQSTADVSNSVTCSSDALVATRMSGCKFHGAGVGDATITATASAKGVAPVSAVLHVSAAALVEVEVFSCDSRIHDEGEYLSASIAPECFDVDSFHITVEQNTILKAVGIFTDGSRIDISDRVAWDSSAIQVAQVSNDLRDIGTATALSAGQAMLTAIELIDDRLLHDSVLLTVVPKVP